MNITISWNLRRSGSFHVPHGEELRSPSLDEPDLLGLQSPPLLSVSHLAHPWLLCWTAGLYFRVSFASSQRLLRGSYDFVSYDFFVCSLFSPCTPPLAFLPSCIWLSLSLSLVLEKAVAPHSSTLAWKILWTEEPGRLQSMGSRRVRHDWATSLSLFTIMHWRRKWHPTPVFLPGESQGQGSLVGCCLWGRMELDTTEAT